MNLKSKHQIFLITRNAVGLLMMGGIVLCPVSMNAEISGTHHDFSQGASRYSDELCKACHTPHHAKTDAAGETIKQSLLWNHTVTAATYTLYSSPTMDATAPSNDLGGIHSTSISKLCLSCHDGTVATNSFGGKIGEDDIFKASSYHLYIGSMGNPLKSHHPVGIVYDSALAARDPKLKNPDTTPSGIEGPAGPTSGGGTISHDLLNRGVLECSSCHDVHVARRHSTESCTPCHPYDLSYSPDFLNTKSLVKSNDGSALCFTCHDK